MLFFVAAALAASPTPDRPSVGAAGALVAADTAELELGVTHQDGLSTPLMLKYSFRGLVEPRLGLNPMGFANEAPGMTAEAKVRLVKNERVAAAATAS